MDRRGCGGRRLRFHQGPRKGNGVLNAASRRQRAGLEALRVIGDVLAQACISVDHPRFLSFVPAAPTEAAILFDLVVGASSIYGGSWMEGGGAVFAESPAPSQPEASRG